MGPRLLGRAVRLTAALVTLGLLAAWIGCSVAPSAVASSASTSTSGSTAPGTGGVGGSATTASGTGGASVGPTPAIFSVADTGLLVAAKALAGQAPFAVHVSALEDVPEPCTWQPPDGGAPCNPEDANCAPDSATPAAASTSRPAPTSSSSPPATG